MDWEGDATHEGVKNYFSLFSNRCSTSAAAAAHGLPLYTRDVPPYTRAYIPNRSCFDGKKIKSLLLSLRVIANSCTRAKLFN